MQFISIYMKRLLFIIFTLILGIIHSQAQEGNNISISKDSVSVLTKKELRKQKTANRNLHYNILGGPSYSPDFGLLIGGSALMTFNMYPSDSTLQRSVVPVALAFMFDGGINLFSKPQLFFKHDRFRIFGKFSYKNTVENYYGIGYDTNRDYIRSDTTSQYRYSGIQINPWFLFRLGNSNFFAGPQIDINYDHFTNPARHLTKEPSYTAAGGNGNGYKNFNSGIGFLLTYDSRDVPANAYKGIYLDFRGMMYHHIFGSEKNFYRLELDYRQYKQVGKRKVIAWTAQSKNVFGNDIPLTQYSLTGTPFDLRGYYQGQYRDKSSHIILAEYRQMFNTDQEGWLKRIISHLGFTAWAGCGFMGPKPTQIEGILPNYGVGLRIEVQPRMNVRLDLGKNTVNNQTLFYFNMTEAF